MSRMMNNLVEPKRKRCVQPFVYDRKQPNVLQSVLYDCVRHRNKISDRRYQMLPTCRA